MSALPLLPTSHILNHSSPFPRSTTTLVFVPDQNQYLPDEHTSITTKPLNSPTPRIALPTQDAIHRTREHLGAHHPRYPRLRLCHTNRRKKGVVMPRNACNTDADSPVRSLHTVSLEPRPNSRRESSIIAATRIVRKYASFSFCDICRQSPGPKLNIENSRPRAFGVL